jgi:peptidoglycan hydrolase-like protein with peptidoglycan-binding domain
MVSASSRAAAVVCATAAVVVVLAGCSSSTKANLAVKHAESVVADKQKALDDAEAQLTAQTAKFCSSTTDYVTALDRYGDVLNTTAVTVGDVKTAGSELAQPRATAVASAQSAVEAQQHVTTAQQDLAKAEATLANAKASASGKPATATASAVPSPTPLAPTATVNRVKQADAEFTTAQRAVTDETALVQASQQFNAAAVALEMSWLKLFADAGCLKDEQQAKAEAAVHDYTAALQQSLTTAGYFTGEVDGVYGPSTVDAVEALQKAHGLPATGTVDKATAAALQSDLQARGGVAVQQSVASTAAVQQTLKLAGYWTGPVDGKWTPELTAALEKFQTALGVKPTGTVDAATVAALEKAIAELHQPPPASSSASTKTTTSSAPSSSSTPTASSSS